MCGQRIEAKTVIVVPCVECRRASRRMAEADPVRRTYASETFMPAFRRGHASWKRTPNRASRPLLDGWFL